MPLTSASAAAAHAFAPASPPWPSSEAQQDAECCTRPVIESYNMMSPPNFDFHRGQAQTQTGSHHAPSSATEAQRRAERHLSLAAGALDLELRGRSMLGILRLPQSTILSYRYHPHPHPQTQDNTISEIFSESPSDFGKHLRICPLAFIR
jgi:hypothetical protein